MKLVFQSKKYNMLSMILKEWKMILSNRWLLFLKNQKKNNIDLLWIIILVIFRNIRVWRSWGKEKIFVWGGLSLGIRRWLVMLLRKDFRSVGKEREWKAQVKVMSLRILWKWLKVKKNSPRALSKKSATSSAPLTSDICNVISIDMDIISQLSHQRYEDEDK